METQGYPPPEPEDGLSAEDREKLDARKQRRIRGRPPGGALSLSDREWIRAMWEEGVGQGKAVKETGFNHKTVRKYYKQYELEKRTLAMKLGKKPPSVDEVKKLDRDEATKLLAALFLDESGRVSAQDRVRAFKEYSRLAGWESEAKAEELVEPRDWREAGDWLIQWLEVAPPEVRTRLYMWLERRRKYDAGHLPELYEPDTVGCHKTYAEEASGGEGKAEKAS